MSTSYLLVMPCCRDVLESIVLAMGNSGRHLHQGMIKERNENMFSSICWSIASFIFETPYISFRSLFPNDSTGACVSIALFAILLGVVLFGVAYIAFAFHSKGPTGRITRALLFPSLALGAAFSALTIFNAPDWLYIVVLLFCPPWIACSIMFRQRNADNAEEGCHCIFAGACFALVMFVVGFFAGYDIWFGSTLFLF